MPDVFKEASMWFFILLKKVLALLFILLQTNLYLKEGTWNISFKLGKINFIPQELSCVSA